MYRMMNVMYMMMNVMYMLMNVVCMLMNVMYMMYMMIYVYTKYNVFDEHDRDITEHYIIRVHTCASTIAVRIYASTSASFLAAASW